MQLDSTFSVVAPIDQVWETLMDFERVAGCVPGVQLQNKLSDDAYQGTMKVKLGPVTMEYKGQMTVVERDATVYRAVFEGRAKEKRGQGTANGTAILQLAETGGTTKGTVNVELSLSGKAAAMGKGVISSVTERMMALFAENLQAIMGGSTPAPTLDVTVETDAGAVSSRAIPSSESTQRLGADSVSFTNIHSISQPTDATKDNSLNALALAKGVIADQLKRPSGIVCLIVIAFFVGRSSSNFVRLGRRGYRRNTRHA